MSAIILNDKEIQQKLKYWQEKLRLGDWKVKLELVPDHKLSSDSLGGECNWSLFTKEAKIEISDTGESRDDGVHTFDHEFILVHELLHLHFAPITDKYIDTADFESFYSRYEENAINMITDGLLAVSRGEKERVVEIDGVE